MTKAVLVRTFGPPEVLIAEELPEPRPGDGQVLIEVAAAGVNFIETLVRSGAFARPGSAQLPYVPGNEVGGTVVAVGAGVDPTLVGRRVVSSTGGRGGYAERVAAPADNVVEVPETLAIDTATALFTHGRTAVGLLREAQLREGECVLVEAAGGGVGSLLVQLAKNAGATVVAAARGEHKLALAASLGADVTVDYSLPGWTDAVRREVGRDGLDVAFDSVGGEVGQEAFGLLRGGGRFLVFGFASGAATEASVGTILERGVTVIGYGGGRPWLYPGYAEELVAEALREAAVGRLRPVIGQRFPLAAAADAHAAIEARTTTGKTLLIP